MTLIGYRSANHPQQVARRGPRSEVDDRATDPAFFSLLNERFRFTLDVAASADNAKCERFYTAEDDGLEQSWSFERVWCNPPYSHPNLLRVEFLPGRIRFIRAGADVVGPNERPPFGCCLLIWGADA